MSLDSASRQSPYREELRLLRAKVERLNTRVVAGRLLGVTGPLIRAELPAAKVGELCELRDPDSGDIRFAEVVGIDGKTVMLAPHGATDGLSIRTEVLGQGHGPSIVVGDHLLGAVVDAFGKPQLSNDDSPPPLDRGATRRSINAWAPAPLSRRAIEWPLATGVRAIDGLITCGEGQRIGIFGNAGVGKSTLVSQIVTSSDADIVVVGLVGERGREVGEFITRTLTAKARNRTVLVVATSDRPALERMQAALVATSIAEHYRDQGKRVLLIIDSVTRLARALREIGLAAGEPPVRRGFPPSVFSRLPLVFERTGMGAIGSITAFYCVLVEGDPMADPIVEETKSLLDGHIMLSEKLAAEGHYPAIDVLESKSRLMRHIVSERHDKVASRAHKLLARYHDVELLIQVGEYRRGTDPLTDEAVDKNAAIMSFLQQRPGEEATDADTLAALEAAVS
jgi:type III secretion protein N (ATPase)